MTEQELSEILSDGRRAYTSFTSADIKQELEAYHDWVEQRATEAQQALDQDLDYQMRKIVKDDELIKPFKFEE